MQFVVYGAGALGSVLGGMLAQHKHDVRLVCRATHAEAIRSDGLKIRSATGDYVVRPHAVTSLSANDVDDDTIVILTVKSQHTAESAAGIAAAVPATTPVVSFQNGTENEGMLLERFENVYGGVCRMTCQMLQPGHASFRRLGRIVVGRYPKGSDARARALAKALGEAGFDASVSRNISADKWLKLAVNSQSVFNAIVDSRDHDANEFSELKARILEETRAVYKAAKIRARSGDGKDPSIDEMIAELRRPRVGRSQHGIKVHNSVWQDLYLKRETLECSRFHEVVIGLAGEHGVSVPCHEVALETVLECHREGTGPGTLRLRDLLARVARIDGKTGS
jgi:2-dehydropantoate 2-reductase